ncbi:MAG: signal peptide peptidase SppA [Planctomycetota bacterium]|jgi:protease-4
MQATALPTLLACLAAFSIVPAVAQTTPDKSHEAGPHHNAAQGTEHSADHAASDAHDGEHSHAPDPRILMVRPSGAYMDLPEQGGDLTTLLAGGGVGKPKPFYELLERLEETAKAEGEHVLFDLSGGFVLNGPQLAEVDRVMTSIRKSGKKTWAYIESASTGSYQIAAACDQILMADLGSLEIGAPSMNVMFMKDAFDLLGVHMDVIRCGDFKGAVEPYVLPRMSEHLRAHYVAMLERINDAAVERIAAGRNMGTAAVRAAQEQRIYTARQALEAGFVDRLVPWSGARAALALATGNEDLNYEDALEAPRERKANVGFMQMLTQLMNPRKEKDPEFEDDTIAVLHLQGGIVDGTSAAAGSIVSGPTVDTIHLLAHSEGVKGVVVRINSPGGSATASEAILLALRDLAEKKPVVFSMGSVAASGGYYVTCIGRPILAEETTITGSIGVFGMKPSLGALLRRVGIHEEIVGLDASASMMSMSEPWTDEQKARMQASVDNIYDVFIGHVARSREKTAGEILKIAGGRVWSGEQAIEVGLVDKIGGLEDALAMVAAEAGLEADGYEISHMPQPKNFLDSLFSDGMVQVSELFDDPKLRLVARRTNLDRALRVIVDALAQDRPTTVWAMMPEAFTIR